MIGVKKVGVCVVIFASPSGHVACRHRKLTDFCTRPPGKGKMRNAENRQRGILRKRDPVLPIVILFRIFLSAPSRKY